MSYIDMNAVKEMKDVDEYTEQQKITLITAFYDIGRGAWKSEYKRNSDTYLQAAKNYLDYDYDVIFFIDDRYYETFSSYFIDSKYPSNKKIVKINEQWLEKYSHVWRQLPKVTEIMNSDKYRDLVSSRIEYAFPENVDPAYNTITNAKIDFIMYAIEHDLVERSSDFICWSDFGYFNSVYKNNKDTFPLHSLDINKFCLDKMNFTLLSEVQEKDKDMLYTLQEAREVFATGLFAGPQSLMKVFQVLCHYVLDEMHRSNISDDDQHVYLRVFFLHAAIFQFYIDREKWPTALTYFQKSI